MGFNGIHTRSIQILKWKYPEIIQNQITLVLNVHGDLAPRRRTPGKSICRMQWPWEYDVSLWSSHKKRWNIPPLWMGKSTTSMAIGSNWRSSQFWGFQYNEGTPSSLDGLFHGSHLGMDDARGYPYFRKPQYNQYNLNWLFLQKRHFRWFQATWKKNAGSWC